MTSSSAQAAVSMTAEVASRNMMRILLAICFLVSSTSTSNRLPRISSSFHSFTQLQHLAIEPSTGIVYVGATNRLYQLDAELRSMLEVRTGPVLDDPRCTEAFGENLCNGGGAAKFEASSTHNVNKVLVVDVPNRQLVICGSVFQGICQTRSLTNISVVHEHYMRGNTDYFIAANDPHSSTVAFSGPGPGNREVLYVATTYTGSTSSGTVRQTIPTVSSRNLAGSNAFRFAYMDGLTGGTLVRLRREAIEKYPISYVAGFSVDGFSYFLSNQPETFSLENSGFLPIVSSNLASKIVQVCQNDHNFHSYVEMPLRCRSANTDYSFVRLATVLQPGLALANRLRISTSDYILLATFSDSLDAISAQSAVCLYRLVDIRAKFTENIRKCFTGNHGIMGSQFSNRLCVPLAMNINESYCGEAEQNGPLVGSIPLESPPILERSDVELTAVAATTIDDVTVAFLGTSEGHLKKVVLEGDGSVREYLDLVIDEALPVKTIKFSVNNSYLYVMTPNKISMVSVSNCDQMTSCDTCRAARDPYCGWCSLERKCSTKSSCSFANRDNFWLSTNAWECIRIPTQFIHISIKKSVQVAIGIKALPVLQSDDQYLCVFGSNLSVSIGIASPNEVRCQTPRLSSDVVPFNKDHINMTLSIRSVQAGVDFVDTTITFFDCSQHRSCSSCSQSSWECFWCVSRNSCTHADEVSDCPEIVIDEHHLCPRLRHITNTDILIPASIPTSIPLAGVFLPAVRSPEGGYECLVHLTAPPVRVPAQRLSASSISCDAYQYTYLPEEPIKTVSLEVVWNGGYVIDDNYGITVTVFKCDMMADDCSTCLSLQEMSDSAKYGCQWCSDRCQTNVTCGSQAATTCPLPDIQEVYPLTGPLEGGTRLTIRGMNLGRNYGQVRHAVKVAGVACEVLPTEYVISRMVVCKTGRVTEPRIGNIVVTVGEATVSWESDFIYQNPQLLRVTPAMGPKSGGTRLTIEGHDLDTGARIQVLLDYVRCELESVNKTEIICTTPSVANAGILPVMVSFDEIVRDLQMDFEYAEDPSITRLQPLTAFRSGGRIITVTGMALNSVRHPVMRLNIGSNVFSSKCVVQSSTVIHCSSPTVVLSSSKSIRGRRSSAVEGVISFAMDSVETVQNLPRYFPAVKSTLLVYPDPIYNPFENGKKIYKGEALILNGQNLNLACDLEEVVVWIGNETCKVNSLDLTTLYCIPPISQPPATSSPGNTQNGLPLVKVVVGNLVFPLGQLEYQKIVVSDSEYWIIGVAVGGGTLLTVIFIILIIYKRKSTHAVRQFKKLNTQLDALESNIRNECKQAFAELQTEVSDFTSDLNDIGIPFWDYKTYTFKVLFPSQADHPLLHCSLKGTLRSGRNSRSYGLQLFFDLLKNSQFLIVFIKTLEEQKNFTIRDKARVASLLMITFHDRMDYATQILKILLNDLIDRSVEKKHPKLMLRRTESVVEKILTNWLSMCMYNYIKTHAGRTMFMLYKAIKHQTEKGPIDAITADARYALSEDRLLREKIEPRPLVCYLLSGQLGPEPISCRMLDCDTISQAKEKVLDSIYKNTPFSRRPSVHDFDLAWLSGRHVRLLLQDEDNGSVTVNGWKKLNTLAHYEVPDGATMALIPRQNKLDTSTHSNGLSDISNNGVLPSVTTPILAVEENSKLFHLVPHDDGQHVGRSQKVISEIFLTRLLATKCTLQQYIDDLFSTILRVEGAQLSAVKYLFDFLDAGALRHGITDPEVVHTWKSNSLLLRFWVNIIKNPEFVFDINKSHIVDSCLSVITQTFMDSCSTHDQRLGKDSPSSKLLFAKDIPRYRHLVTQFYKGIQDLPPITDQEMANVLAEQCSMTQSDFNVDVALHELFNFARQYNFELLEALDDDVISRRQKLSTTFEQMSTVIEGSST